MNTVTNTIPTTFNERKVSHTIIGGMQYRGQNKPEDFCVVVLNRGRKYYRPFFFEQLLAEGFTSVISIESSPDAGDMESLTTKFPQVRFLLPQEKLTVGEMINLGFAETVAPYIMVLWNDTRIPPGSFTDRVLEKIREAHLLCAAPVLANVRGEAVPNQMVSIILFRILIGKTLISVFAPTSGVKQSVSLLLSGFIMREKRRLKISLPMLHIGSFISKILRRS